MGIKAGLIFLFAFEMISASALDMKLLSKSSYLDQVTMPDDTQYIVYLNKLPKDTPEKNNIKETYLQPKWKFYHQKRTNKTMAIATLAPQNNWFDATSFNTLDIQGKCKDCQVALADKTLFLKEDNYYIAPFSSHVHLNQTSQKLDFKELKYLILTADKKEDINVTSLLFHTRFPSGISFEQHLSVWAWAPNDIDLPLLKKHHIQRVYLQIAKGFEKVAKTLYQNGLTVYGLDGDPHDIFDAKRLQKSIKRIAALNLHEKIISGFEIDVEPHILKSFNLQKEDHIKRFMTLIHTLAQELHRHGLKFSIVTPFWYDTLKWRGSPLINSVIDTADETVLMSYRSNAKAVIKISEYELVYASLKHKDLRIGVELMPIADEEHHLYKLGQPKPCIAAQKIQQKCRNLTFVQHYTIKGSDLSFYQQNDQLQKLLEMPVDYPAFKGFVLHQMRALH